MRSLIRGFPADTLVLSLTLALAMPGIGRASNVRDMWATDGEVRAIAHGNNALYLGGTFSHVGPASGPAVALDLGTAVALTPYPGVAGIVNAVAPDGSGGWYIGGQFTAVQGQLRNNIAQIDAAGQLTSWRPRLDSWDPRSPGAVYDIAVGAGVVYVVGTFKTVGTQWGGVVKRQFAAALDPTTGEALDWDPHPDDGVPNHVEVGGGKVYLAGPFSTVSGGVPRYSLAEFTEVVPGVPGTGSLTTFAPLGPEYFNTSALKVSAGKLFVSATRGVQSDFFVFDQATGLSPYTVPLVSMAFDVAVDQAHGVFFVGWGNGILAVDLATGEFVPWSIAADGTVRTLALAPSGLLVGGDFLTLGGAPRRGIGLVDPAIPAVFSWDAACRGNVNSVAVDGANAYVGGDFRIINSVPRTNLAAMDETSGALLPWSPATNATVEALMVNGNTVYVGGQFTSVNGTARACAAGVDGVTGALTAFNPEVQGTGPVTTVKTFALNGTTVYMGGIFEFVGGLDHFCIAAVRSNTGAPLVWDPAPNGAVNAISFVPGGVFGNAGLVVGGEFTAIGGQFRNYLSTLDAATGAAGNPLATPNGPVTAMFVENLPPGTGGFNQAFIGGNFTSVGGQPRNHIASVAGLGLLSWDPNADGVVFSIDYVGTTAFVGGAFMTIGGKKRNGIAAIDGSGAATTWDPHADIIGTAPSGLVYSLLESAGVMYAGGLFTSIEDTPHSNFAGIAEILTAVDGPVPKVAPISLRATPNPFDESTKILFYLPIAGDARITIYDVTGRRVRELHQGWLSSGRHAMPWDGREDSGRPVAAGVYFLGVRTQTGALGSKVFRVR